MRPFLIALLLTLLGLPAMLGRAADLTLSVSLGIGGRYRPNVWYPVYVSVTNTGAETIHGQVQARASDDPSRASQRPTVATFARTITLPPGGAPQIVTVYVRNLDPSRDDLTVQVAEGGARGDGRILAKTSFNVTSSGGARFGGIPVDDRDPLLVAFGGNPAAFSFLSGQKWGLDHAPGGLAADHNSRVALNGTGTLTMPASVQVAAAAVSGLPEKAAGYGGVDVFLLRADAPLESLTEAQADALKQWVAAGGHLVVCGSADPSRFANPVFANLLPARVGALRPSVTVPSVGQTAALSLTPKSGADVRILMKSADGTPLVIRGAYGAGSVVLTAFDPTTLPFQTWNGAASTAFWRMLSTGGDTPSSVLATVADREEQAGNNPYNWGQTQLSDAVMRAPSLDVPATATIGLFLLAYLLILVPLNYLILKRLDRKEWAWVTIPALVVLFAAGTYAVGYAAKGGALFVNRAAIVETSAGQRTTGVYAAMGLFSPHRTAYDIALPDPNALSAIPGARDEGRGGRSSSGNDYGETRFVQNPSSAAVQDASVNMWAMRAFDVQTIGDLGGTVDANLALDFKRQIVTGTVTNHTSYALADCAVLYRGAWQTVGDMTPGANAPLTLTALGPLPGTRAAVESTGTHFQIPTGGGSQNRYGGYYGYPGRNNDMGGAQGDVSTRMRAALADFGRSLGQDYSNGYYGNGYNSQQPDFYAPRANEAVFVGWSTDPELAGPAPRVDGHSVTEHDVSLVVVHIPVAGATSALPPANSLSGIGTISKTSALYRQAIDVSTLNIFDAVRGKNGRMVALQGTVLRVYRPPMGTHNVYISFVAGNHTVFVMFGGVGNGQFGDLRPLQGKHILVSGRFNLASISHGGSSIILDPPQQIKLVK